MQVAARSGIVETFDENQQEEVKIPPLIVIPIHSVPYLCRLLLPFVTIVSKN